MKHLMNEGKQSINITICGRSYNLIIDPVHEENIRLAAKMVNERVEEFKKRFEKSDEQDFLSMTALDFTVKMLELKNKGDDSILLASVEEQVRLLESELRQ